MGLLLLLHLVVGFAVIATGEQLGRRALPIAALPSLCSIVWLATALPEVLDGGVVTESATWVPQLGLALDLRLDGFAALMVLLVSGIGLLVFAYAHWYFPARGEALGRLIGLLTLFSGAMLGLVLADNLLVLYGCWELTSVTSFFLIGNKHASARARAAALQALLITGLGALAMLVGFILIGQQAGTYQLSSILADPPGGTVTAVALVLVLLGAVTKSAQYPFHSWLPGAMVAPTPISAYLHSATMVKAGVYLVARFTPAFVGVGFWRPAVVTIGAASMLFGGLRALRQHDLKLLLAFGTISQLGFMFVLFGIGTAESVTAGCVLVLAHAVFKATLFMSVGVMDHQLGTRDIRHLPRLVGSWPALSWIVAISAASMAGIPLTFGFIAKEAGYESLLHSHTRFGVVAVVVVVCAAVVTFAYSTRLLHGGLYAASRDTAGRPAPEKKPAALFVAIPGALTAVTVVLGLLPALADPLMSAASSALDPEAPPTHLAIWHGLNVALVLSLVTILGGSILFIVRNRVSTVLALGAGIPSGGQAYRWTLRAMNTSADRVTGIVQSGSLPVYAGVILATTTLVPVAALSSLPLRETLERGVDAPRGVFVATLLVVAILLAAAFGAAAIRRRYAAALLLAGVGYSMAGLFVLQGAPDLALTTVAVESLFTVLFVLVLRSLPDRFEQHSPRFGTVFRLVVASVVGLVVFGFALLAGNERLPSTTSEEMVARSLPDGHGRNVVNVILVDFRGFDTLGEITVLAAAAIGAVALARAVMRPGRPPEQQPEAASHPEHTAATGSAEVAP